MDGTALDVDVRWLGRSEFEILDFPTLLGVEGLVPGARVRVEPVGPDMFRLIEIVEPSPLTTEMLTLPDSLAASDRLRTWIVEFRAAGGLAQIEMGGLLSIGFDPESERQRAVREKLP